ncbi:MAG: hypothetical protein IK093_08645 [Ruminiclostridium sp.]|nr:hypothetical protein [Ruminiclostridium sp.]
MNRPDEDKRDVLTEAADEEQKREIDRARLAETMLQGAVVAPEYIANIQMTYGPPPNVQGLVSALEPPPNTMGFFAARHASWLDDGTWKCTCGQENTGKFCIECGSSAPPKPWKCPRCGNDGNEGKFCPECGTGRPE